MKIDKKKLAALQMRERSHVGRINGVRRAINEARADIVDMRNQAQMRNAPETRAFAMQPLATIEGASDAEMQELGIDFRVVRRMLALNAEIAQLSSEEVRLQAETGPFLDFMQEVDRLLADSPAGSLEFVDSEPRALDPSASCDALHSQLNEVRSRISALTGERSLLIDHPRSRADCIAVMDRKIDEWQETADRKNRAAWLDVAQGERPRFLALETWDYGPLALTLLGADALRASLLRTVDAAPEGADREARLKQLAAELDKVEREEERVVCQLEQLGQPVLRRRDARPEIVLAAEV